MTNVNKTHPLILGIGTAPLAEPHCGFQLLINIGEKYKTDEQGQL